MLTQTSKTAAKGRRSQRSAEAHLRGQWQEQGHLTATDRRSAIVESLVKPCFYNPAEAPIE